MYIGGGNSTNGCAKIYKRFDVLLPGGFRLPLAAIKETVIYDTQSNQQIPADEGMSQMLLRRYIIGDMVAGKIIETDTTVSCVDDLLSVSGVFTCEEMIGRLQNEEI